MTPHNIDSQSDGTGRPHCPIKDKESCTIDEATTAADHAIDCNMYRDSDDECNDDVSNSVDTDDNKNKYRSTAVEAENTRFSDAGYYLDSRDLELDDCVDPREYPPYDVAQRLVEHYTRTVHDWFPILPFVFLDQLKNHYETPLSVANTWSATLNLVCAIGTQHALLVTAPESRCKDGMSEREDVPYLSRALLLLEVKGASLLSSVPDMAQVRVGFYNFWVPFSTNASQCLGLLSFYYLAAGHVDRCVGDHAHSL